MANSPRSDFQVAQKQKSQLDPHSGAAGLAETVSPVKPFRTN
jgi:hypothetical protein